MVLNNALKEREMMIENWIGFESDFTRNLIRVLICFVRSLESFRVRSERERKRDLVSLSSLLFGRGSKRERERETVMCFIYSLLFAPPINKELFMKKLA